MPSDTDKQQNRWLSGLTLWCFINSGALVGVIIALVIHH